MHFYSFRSWLEMAFNYEEVINELKKVITEFIVKGVIPCNEVDIINGKLPPDTDNWFQGIGINLKQLVNSFSIKTEQLAAIKNEDANLDEYYEPAIDLAEESIEFKCNYDQSDDYFGNDDDYYGDDMDYEEEVDANDNSNVVETDEEDDDGGGGTDSQNNKKGHWPCEICNEVFASNMKKREHAHEVHFFENIRGLFCKNRVSAKDHHVFVSHKSLLEYKEKLKNLFAIQIPPPDFTKENYDNFKFSKPIEEYVVITDRFLNRMKVMDSGSVMCRTHKNGYSSIAALKDHLIRKHKIKFRCPYEKCGFKTQSALLTEFTRHMYYHENPHPGLMFSHSCLACEFTSPFLQNVKEHIKSQGPYHDNKCARCPERFESLEKRLQHEKEMKHEGFKCGLCPEVFDSHNLKEIHRRKCRISATQSLRKYICDLCGKVLATQNSLKRHREVAHGPKQDTATCEICGAVLKNKFNLQTHMSSSHRKQERKQCPECGKFFHSRRLNRHILYAHTEDHLKPHVCKICGKGFIEKQSLGDHENIHTGRKPYLCKYGCGKDFADKGNLRMHERTAHEGDKRTEKRKKTNANTAAAAPQNQVVVGFAV